MADTNDNAPDSPPPSGPWREPIADGLGGGDTKGSPFRRSKNSNQEFVPPSADYFPQPTLAAASTAEGSCCRGDSVITSAR